MSTSEFRSLEEAFAWLAGLPALLDVDIHRTNRTGEKELGRNIHGRKSWWIGDWEVFITVPLPVPGEVYETASWLVASGDDKTLLGALNMAREEYDRNASAFKTESFKFSVWEKKL